MVSFQYRDSSDILKTQNGFEYDSFSITQIKGSFKVLTGDVRRVPKLRPTKIQEHILLRTIDIDQDILIIRWVDIIVIHILMNKLHRI